MKTDELELARAGRVWSEGEGEAEEEGKESLTETAVLLRLFAVVGGFGGRDGCCEMAGRSERKGASRAEGDRGQDRIGRIGQGSM